MPGIFGDDFLSLLSPLATAQYRPTPSAIFPSPAAAAPAPGLLQNSFLGCVQKFAGALVRSLENYVGGFTAIVSMSCVPRRRRCGSGGAVEVSGSWSARGPAIRRAGDDRGEHQNPRQHPECGAIDAG